VVASLSFSISTAGFGEFLIFFNFFFLGGVLSMQNGQSPLMVKLILGYSERVESHVIGHVCHLEITPMTEQFIGEAIQPVSETIDADRMTRGEPGLPRQFRWRSETVCIVQVLGTWKETGPCRNGSGEQYVRKHWFDLLKDSGVKMKIYFERQARSTKKKERWWLFSIEKP
jgi:hypothetical protein